MAIELHHLHPSHDDELSRLKARIAELEKLNHNLCERVTENDEIRLHWEEIEQTRAENERMKARIAELEARNHELKEERRWRKISEEKPKQGDLVLVCFAERYKVHYFPIDVARWDSSYELSEYEITHWMPLPSAPREEQ